jgi:cell division protein FtsI (penicillin-binding protein 3)
MDLAVQKSSNIYMARIIHRLIDRMGEAWYRQALADFGFGHKTNVELPAESGGLLPTPGKMHPNGKLEWSVPTPASLSMGHNILVNSLQIVRSYAILANGGMDVQPHLLRKIVKDGKTLVDNTVQKPMRRILSPKITKPIVRAMKFATKEGGTSKRADIMHYTEAGKSGTAEKIIDGIYSKDHNISSFIGMAPAENPRFVLLVSIDDPEKKVIPGVGKHQMGGVCAAPVFRNIATQALEFLGVTPDDPNRDDWAAEVKALRELYEKWNSGNSPKG